MAKIEANSMNKEAALTRGHARRLFVSSLTGMVCFLPLKLRALLISRLRRT